MTDILDAIAVAALVLAGLLAVGRILRDGSLADRMLGADTLTIVISSGIGAGYALTGRPSYLDVLMVVTTLGFVGTITVARYIEHRGARG